MKVTEMPNEGQFSSIPKIPTGRSLSEFLPLSMAEEKLLAYSVVGRETIFNEARPVEKNSDNAIRATFLRFLSLGGDENVPIREDGIQIVGGWIFGDFTLQGVTVSRSIFFHNCVFDSKINLVDTHCAGVIYLAGSLIPGMAADRMTCDGGLLFRDGFTCNGTLELNGAIIGGDLQLQGSTINGVVNENGIAAKALSATGITVRGNIILCGGAKISGGIFLDGARIDGRLDFAGATVGGGVDNDGVAVFLQGASIAGSVWFNNGFSSFGTVNLMDVAIDGSCECAGGRFDGNGKQALSADRAKISGSVNLTSNFIATGTVSLSAVKIGSDLDCSNATFDESLPSVHAVAMRVEGRFFFCDLKRPAQGVRLLQASVGQLYDDATAWGDELELDGFVYNAFTRHADAKFRLEWLDKQNSKSSGRFGSSADFRPHPWQQLQNVFRNMGYVDDARQVAIAFEDRLLKIGKVRNPLAHHIFRMLIGYGHRPWTLGKWIVGTWLVCCIVYWYAAVVGVFAPANPLIFDNPRYAICGSSYHVVSKEVGGGNWYNCAKLPGEHSSFSPLIYSLDVLLPFVDLGQETSWSPMTPTPLLPWYKEIGSYGLEQFVRFLIVTEALLGWIFGLLIVSVFSGLIRQRSE